MLQPELALLTRSFDGDCYPVHFKVAVETNDKYPRVSWQASRPLKILSSLTSGMVIMFVALGLEANLSHTQIEHLEKAQFSRTVPRGHIYLSITRIKISRLLQGTQLMKSCLIWPSWIIPMISRGQLSPALLHLPPNQGHRILQHMFQKFSWLSFPRIHKSFLLL